MNLLAIDTSTHAQVLGLMVDEAMIDRTEIAGREHSQLILPAIVALLDDNGMAPSDLDGIAFGKGPGSFTGLRIGIGVVQGLAFGLSLPVAPISTLAVLAQAEYRRSGAAHIVVALHARKDEVYFGSYEVVDGIVQLVGREAVHSVADLPVQAYSSCTGIGDGWQFADEMQASMQVTATDIVKDVVPSSEALLLLGARLLRAGHGVAAIEARPEYLREQVAALPGSGESQ